MFYLAILLGTFGEVIFLLGRLGILGKFEIGIISLVFVIIGVTFGIKACKFENKIKNSIWDWSLLAVISSQLLVNLIGSLGPELAFDSLWYHLTLPKLYLLNESIKYFPGEIFKYSAMPQLGEMYYIVALLFGNEIHAKLIHFVFGVFCLVATYKFSRVYLTKTFSLLCILILSSNLVFAWEMTTAYIDLVRTFFEIMALWSFVMWWKGNQRQASRVKRQEESFLWIVVTGLMVGFAASTKLLGLGTLGIYSVLILYRGWPGRNKLSNKHTLSSLLLLLVISLSVLFPWLLYAYNATGNPVFPFFTKLYPTDISFSLLNPAAFLSDLVHVFTKADDPLSPIYLIMFPLLVVYYKRLPKEIKLIVWYSATSFIVWYITPRTGGGRFILPFLPAYSLLVTAYLLHMYQTKQKLLFYWCITLVIFISFLTLVYRGVANAKYLPVILGQQTKHDFLTSHLNFSFGDFVDSDNYFARNIKLHDKVLLLGFHNMYYVNFPFVTDELLKPRETFTHIVVQNGELAQKYKGFKLIHENTTTHVKVYRKP